MKKPQEKVIYKKRKLRLTLKTPMPNTTTLVGIILATIGSAMFLFVCFQLLQRHIIAGERSKMKPVPLDVKKTIVQEQKTASISATLHVPILMYHYVEYVQDKRDTERQKLNVTPYVFELQLQTLLAARYTFITVKQLGDIFDGKISAPPNPIILTFDDGHWDLDTSILPILKKYNIHATAYIVPGFIGTNTDSLTPMQMQDVVNSGLIDIGAHTVHHLYLKGRPLATVQSEVDESKRMLEDMYHIHVYSFAYPYGAFDQQALSVVKQAGFTTAASTIAGSDQNNQSRFILFRIRPGYLTGQALLTYLNYKWPKYLSDNNE